MVYPPGFSHGDRRHSIRQKTHHSEPRPGAEMTSRALAAYVGITEQNLSLLKSGKVKGIRFDTLAKICQALECQPGDILAWEAD